MLPRAVRRYGARWAEELGEVKIEAGVDVPAQTAPCTAVKAARRRFEPNDRMSAAKRALRRKVDAGIDLGDVEIAARYADLRKVMHHGRARTDHHLSDIRFEFMSLRVLIRT